MAEWIQFDPSKLFPTDLASVASEAATLGNSLAGIMDVAADVLDVVKLFVGGYADAQKAAVGALQSLIASTVEQLTQTGVFWLQHIPTSWKINTTPTNWINTVSRSLNDTYDEKRPILVDPYAYIGCISVLGVTSSHSDLWVRFRKLFELFGALTPSIDQVKAWPSVRTAFTPTPGVGQAPDWDSKRIADFVPGIGEIVDTLLDFSDSVSAAATASDIYSMFANQLRSKATVLRNIGTTVEQILDDLVEATDFTGAYILPVYGQGDKAWLQNQLKNSTGGPIGAQDAEFSAGMVFLAVGGTTAPADILFSLFGISP